MGVLAVVGFGLGSDGADALPLDADFMVTFDDRGARAIDAHASVSPGEHVTLSAGAGHSSGSDETAGLEGTLLDAGISVHGGRMGVSVDFDSFDDSSNYKARTLAARAWFRAGDFELALLGRQRVNEVDLTLDLPLRTVRRGVDFAGVGGGLQVSFARATFNAYAMALRFEYDEDLDQFLTLADSPQLADRPRIEALVGSFMTQAQGAVDRQAAAGVERTFGRHSVALDVASVHDALMDSHSTSIALTYHNVRSARVDWSISAGVLDSDAFGSTAFTGISLGLSN